MLVILMNFVSCPSLTKIRNLGAD